MSDKFQGNGHNNIHTVILNSCDRFGEKRALIGKGGAGNEYSYFQLREKILSISEGLKKIGLEEGERIGILAESCPEWGIGYLAILSAGGVVVPLDPALKETELRRFFRISKIKILFCSDKLIAKADEIIALNDLAITTYSLDPEHKKSIFTLARDVTAEATTVDPDNMAVLIYTSGTTGDPKGVMLTHRNIVANMVSIQEVLACYETDRMLSLLPMHHTFEATAGFLHPLHSGMTIVYCRALNTRDILKDIQDNQITCLVAVPLLYEKLFNTIGRRLKALPLFKRSMLDLSFRMSKLGWKMKLKWGKILFRSLRKKAGLSSLRMFISGGAPLPDRVSTWFNLIGFDFFEGYGLTECSPVVSVNRSESNIFGSVGPPLPGVEVKINNPDEKGIGEIIIRGDNITPGYLDNPEATDELLKDDWLYSGDLGKIEKGHLFITGRQKNLIVTGGGKNVYPEEIEAELNSSRFILESVVIGRKKKNKTGEEIWALVVPDPEEYSNEEKATPESIRSIIEKEIKQVNSKLADYKRIEKFEIRMEEFEKTSTKKIKRTLYL